MKADESLTNLDAKRHTRISPELNSRNTTEEIQLQQQQQQIQQQQMQNTLLSQTLSLWSTYRAPVLSRLDSPDKTTPSASSRPCASLRLGPSQYARLPFADMSSCLGPHDLSVLDVRNIYASWQVLLKVTCLLAGRRKSSEVCSRSNTPWNTALSQIGTTWRGYGVGYTLKNWGR